MFILGGFLFSAIFYGVAFSIKKEVFLQNPVNTPQKNGDPKYFIDNKKSRYNRLNLPLMVPSVGLGPTTY